MAVEIAELGDVVKWYDGGERNTAPRPAIVTAVGIHGLLLHITDPMLKGFMVRDGVPHVEHERAKKPEAAESGAWEHTARTRRLIELEQLTGTAKPRQSGG